MLRLWFFACLLLISSLAAQEGEEPEACRLFRDLLIADYWTNRLNDRLPVTYNQLFQGGYLVMPSARMGCEGEVGIGYTSLPPFTLYNLRCQFLSCLEITGNYRIFKNIPDPILSQYGFGDLSDKGANIKLTLLHPEDSGYQYPGIAIGTEDFIGTKGFHARYIVLTKVFLKYNLEVSLGYGWKRLGGFFGGIAWHPLRHLRHKIFSPLCIVAEWDATRYSDPDIEKHPHGRRQRSKINVGVKYRFRNLIDVTASYIRGQKWAFSVAGSYNLGHTKGLFPKIHDPLPYRAPVNYQDIGIYRSEEILMQDLIYAFRAQGFEIIEGRMCIDPCGNRILWIQVDNTRYRLEPCVRQRISCLLSSLIPLNILRTVVVMEAEGMAIQQYCFETEYLRQYAWGHINAYELCILSPLQEATRPTRNSSKLLYKRHRNHINVEIFPKSHTLFGSARGKFKYALGVALGINGFILNDIFYSVQLGYIFVSDMHGLADFDRLNPSQLINVRTDSLRYFRQKSITVDQAYLQKNIHCGKGFYFKAAGGYFEQAYGGIASELLYFPLNRPFAVGLEGAIVKKRRYNGIAYTNTIRKLIGTEPTHRPFLGSQYFGNFYFKWDALDTDIKISAGKFLANDYGVRYQLSRYYPSGLRIFFWYTWTNGNDKINGHTYHDRGVGLSMPLDILYTYSSRSRTHYELAAWLRDVGAQAYVGRSLYEIINENRQ